MKKSIEVFILFVFFLCAEFVGADGYRTLVNNNYSRKEESNSFKEEKTRNAAEDFDGQGDKIDVAGARNGMTENLDEGEGVFGMDKDDDWVQGGIGQEINAEKSGEVGLGKSEKENSLDNASANGLVIIEGKGPCTCGEQVEKGGEGEPGGSGENMEQGTQSENDVSSDRTNVNSGQGNIVGEQGDGKDEAENEESESKQLGSEMMETGGRVQDAEDTNGGSGEHVNMGVETVLETSTAIEKNEEQIQTDKNGNNGDDLGVQTFRFSPLDR